MKDLLKYIDEAIVNKRRTTEYNPRGFDVKDIYYTYDEDIIGMLINGIEDIEYCFELNHQKMYTNFRNEILEELNNGSYILLYFHTNGNIDYLVCSDRYELQDNWDFVCKLNLEDFKQNIFEKEKEKYVG